MSIVYNVVDKGFASHDSHIDLSHTQHRDLDVFYF